MSVLKRWVVPGVVAVGITTAGSLYSKTDTIEVDLTTRSEAVLAEAGADWAKIALSGRDLTLKGTAPTKQAAPQALALLKEIRGVRVVKDETQLLSEQKPYSWGLRHDADKASMFGYLPYEMTKTVPEMVQAKIGAEPLDNSVEAARGAPEGIDKAVALAADLFSQLPKGKVELIDNTLTVSAKLDDGDPDQLALYNKIRKTADTAKLGNVELTLDVNQPIAPELAKPANAQANKTEADMPDGLLISRTAEGVTLTGALPTQSLKEKIVSLARRKFGLAVSDNLQVKPDAEIAGLDAASFEKVSASMLQSVSRLGEGQASLTADGLALSGNTFYQAALDQVKSSFEGLLPQSFKLNSQLSVAEPGSAIQADQCQDLLHKALANNTILFKSGKADISDDSYGLIDGLIYTAHRCPDSRIRIEGHTDSDGDDASNQTLSEERAAAVLSYLTAAGIAPDRLIAKGFGETKPIASNDTPEGKASNRRIEFVILRQ